MIKKILEKFLGRKNSNGADKQPGAQNGNGNSAAAKRPRIKQIYEGPRLPRPDFAQNVDDSDLVDVLYAHLQCQYRPHIEYQRIYKPGRRRVGGDLDVLYEGIAATCPAVKQFAAKVAEEDGLIQGYRYVDLNHIFACCCGAPDRCRFYQLAVGERQAVDSRQRRSPR